MPVVTGVTAFTGAVTTQASTQAVVSDSGALAFIEGTGSFGSRYEVTFIDRRGVVEPLRLPETASYVFPRLSPDARQIVLGADDGKEARLWIYDVSGTNAPRQLALGGNSRYPLSSLATPLSRSSTIVTGRGGVSSGSGLTEGQRPNS